MKRQYALLIGAVMVSLTALSQNVGIGTSMPASTFEINGSFGSPVTTVAPAGSLTLSSSHSTVLAGAGATLTLPSASTASRRVYNIIYNSSSGSAVTVNRSGSDNIVYAGANNTSISLNSGSFSLQSNGTNWVVISNSIGTASQSANKVYASPDGSAGVPGFRSLVSADIPDLSSTYIKNSTSQQSSSNFNISGSGIIGSLAGTGTRPVFSDANGQLVTSVTNPASNNTTVTIPDNGCSTNTSTSSTITLSGIPTSVAAANISVTVNITHGDVSQLRADLVSPGGAILNLINTGQTGVNLTNTVFNDGGSTTFPTSGVAPYTGTFKPTGSGSTICTVTPTVTSFSGMGTINPNGTWTLKVYDAVSGTTGSLQSWSITINNLYGTDNYVPKWTSSGLSSSSNLFDNGTNIGIGTTAPVVKLQVYGDIMAGTGTNVYPTVPAGAAALSLNASTSALIRMVANDGSGTYNQYLNAYYDASAASHKYSNGVAPTRYVNSNGTIGFYVAPSGSAGNNISWTTAEFIDNSGNVGIGTNNPYSTLDVSGSQGSAITTLSSGSLTLSASHSTIMASAGTSITLPACSTATRRVYTIVYNSSSGSAVSIAPNSADAIYNAGASVGTSGSPYSLTGGSITIQSDGNSSGKWYVTGSTAASSGGSGSNLLGIQTISSGTSYTPTTGTTKILLKMVGGGGAGGGAKSAVTDNISVGGGGGSGAYFQKYITLVAGTYTISIGSAGTGASAAAGGNGGNTTFQNGTGGTIYTAAGGNGGAYLAAVNNVHTVTAGGDGGSTPTGGDINSGGTPGGCAIDRAPLGEYHFSGAGASSQFGAGGAAVTQQAPASQNLTTNGDAASGYGAGGGGAYAQQKTGTQNATGGNGTKGVIIIYEYQ